MTPEQLHERVENDFTLHPPHSPETARTMDQVRSCFRNVAHFVVDHTPPSREQSTALTKLEEALYHAIAAIARNQEHQP